MSKTLTNALVISTLLLGAASNANAQTPKKGGVLDAAWQQEPVSLDPHASSAYSSFQILENVLDTLVVLDEKGNPQPSLAKDWKVSQDGKTWTFNLRPGVKFSNGRALSAKDVVYTYERMLDPKTGSGNAYLLEGVQSVKAPNANTVVFTLKSPRTNFLTDLASNKSTGIIAQESVKDGTIATKPLGTGPFMITKYQPGVGVTLARNPHYWQQGLPYLDGINIKVIPDESVNRSALVSGDVDWAISVPPQSVPQLKQNKNIKVDEVPAFAYWYMGVNTKKGPLAKKEVRQAIAEVVDRNTVVQGAVFGQGKPTQDPIPSSSSWSYGYAPYKGDLSKAKALLSKAGYPNGFETELLVTPQYPESIRAAQVLQSQLAPLGIRANIKSLEWAQWLEEQGKGNYDMYVMSWNGLVDPNNYFYAQHRTGQNFNFTGYSNKELDALLDKGRTSTDPKERREIYEKVNRIIVNDAPYIYLYNPLNTNAYRNNVKGYKARPDQAVNFTKTWLDK